VNCEVQMESGAIFLVYFILLKKRLETVLKNWVELTDNQSLFAVLV